MKEKKQEPKLETCGTCSVCLRGMVPGHSVDEHHWVPVVKGGKKGAKSLIHRMCHQKIHSVWTEGELARQFNHPEIIREAPEMQTYLVWVQSKPLDYYDSTKMNNRKRR
jgi:hypothetical protein